MSQLSPLNVSPYEQDEFCLTLALYKLSFYWLWWDSINTNCGFIWHDFSYFLYFSCQILALVAVRKGMDYLFSQHDLSFLDDVIPEKDKKKKEDEKKKKKKKGSLDSDNDDVRSFLKFRSKAS